MSTNFNNNKRHCFDKACYGGAPHSSPKRVRKTKAEIKNEKETHHYMFNFSAFLPIWLIWTEFQGDDFLKIIATAFILAGCFHSYITKGEE